MKKFILLLSFSFLIACSNSALEDQLVGCWEDDNFSVTFFDSKYELDSGFLEEGSWKIKNFQGVQVVQLKTESTTAPSIENQEGILGISYRQAGDESYIPFELTDSGLFLGEFEDEEILKRCS